MVNEIPPGLRRRRGVGAIRVQEEPMMIPLGLGPDVRPVESTVSSSTNANANANALWKFSRVYCSLSALVAILAIITAQSSSFANSSRSSVFFDATATILRDQTESVSASVSSASASTSTTHSDVAATTTAGSPGAATGATVEQRADGAGISWFRLKALSKLENSAPPRKHHQHHHQHDAEALQKLLPGWIRWLVAPHHHNDNDKQTSQPGDSSPTKVNGVIIQMLTMIRSFLDPSLLDPSPRTLTDLIDKVITSTPRLLAIANLLLSLTFLLHTAVADWFLGAGIRHSQDGAAGRERLGGFLIFKLLLISAVVGPDTLDLLILLSWYTLLSFLRSLAHLCAGTTQHTLQSGQPPRTGVLKLLLAVLLSDFLAAAVCVALFHAAGWGMVVLLTCDCALLAVDVLCNILLHAGQVLEVQHSDRVALLEAQQLRQERPQHLERQLELLEQQQVRRVYILETTVFSLQLINHMLTVGHFVHIWTLYGVQFTLIDGVLALHLHSALSSASKKIAERRNLYRIARDMDGMFEEATELELRKASAAGDVCCICLGAMTMGNVKKVGCGHLYHTSCLREVVERARSMESARCPLCRASMMDGQHRLGGGNAATTNNNRLRDAATTMAPNEPVTVDAATTRNRGLDNNNNNAAPLNLADTTPVQQNNNNNNNNGNAGEHALFRFSTEGIFPRWVPLPSFSFEVVRRPTVVAAPQDINNDNNNNNTTNNNAAAAVQQEPPQPSLLRRLLVVAGVIPMTPEEEAVALDQLVDMFPQYDRADLLRELRRRGSSEAVAESVLGGGVIAPMLQVGTWQRDAR